MPTTAAAFRIDPATIDDAPAIAPLLAELGYPPIASALADTMRRLATTGCDPVFVARQGASLIGVIALHWTTMLHRDRPDARITALVVAAAGRRHAVGRRLVAHAIAAARDAGCGRIELTSGNARAGAHAFYRDLGFAQSSLRFHRMLDDGTPA